MKWVRQDEGDKGQLYDLSMDPKEKNDGKPSFV